MQNANVLRLVVGIWRDAGWGEWGESIGRRRVEAPPKVLCELLSYCDRDWGPRVCRAPTSLAGGGALRFGAVGE